MERQGRATAINHGGRRRPRSPAPGGASATAAAAAPRPTRRNKKSGPSFDDLDAGELVERGAAHARLSLLLFSKAKGKLRDTEDRDSMKELPTSFSVTTHYKQGVISSFSMDPPLVPPTCFPASSGRMERQGSKVDLNQNLNQGHESFTARFNCGEYRIVVRRTLISSDVRDNGRIGLPKKDVEANLPAFLESDCIYLKMEDFKLPMTWEFRYRLYKRSTDSIRYVMASTGNFVKTHSLKKGDTFIIYQSRREPGKFLVRGEKATKQRAPFLCLECKDQVCGFAEGA